MRNRVLFMLCLLFCIVAQAFAQLSISGKVVDDQGLEVPGVNIIVKGSTVGAMTDINGAFTFSEVPDGKNVTLVFSCVGFQSQEVKVGNQNTINVTLHEDSEQLDEVVVIGYGAVRKKDLSGAISNVRMTEDLAALPNPNVMSALSSKVAGFRYSPTNSAGGNNFGTLNIRGKNAIPAGSTANEQSVNQPLLVVDGVISHANLNEINTNDIQSVDVLKDASASAIYGSRAANGVIIITTKRGMSEKPVINANTSWSFSGWSRRPKMVTDKEKFMKNRFYANQANGTIPADVVWSPDYDKAQLLSSVELDAYNEGIYTDWLDEISRMGFGQKYDVNVSGRSKVVNYYVSGDYTRQQGIRLGDDYQKYNVMSKLDIQAKEWLQIGLKGNYMGAKGWGVPARIQNATWISPFSFKNARQPGYEDWPNSKPDGNALSPLWGTGAGDSYLWTDSKRYDSNVNGVAYAQVDFPFLKGLSYRITLSAYHNTSTNDNFNDPRIWVDTDNTAQMDNPSQFGSQVSGYSYTQINTVWNVDNIFTYAHDFKKHHVDAMIGYTREAANNELLRTDFKGFSAPTFLGVYKQELADTRKLRRERSQSSAIGILARASYNYNSTYYANFTFRRDGYSAFAVDHKWGNFYGASAAWVLSNESFIRDNASWLNYLKLRLSWGQNGSRSVTPYSTVGAVGTTYTWFGDASTGSAYAIVPTTLSNHTLTWATIEKYNVGIDFDVLGGRLSGAIDAYVGNTKNMLMNRSIPYPSGFQSAKANAGKVTNKGVEITINSVNINGDGKDKFRWETNLVFDLNRNAIKSLYGKNYAGVEADDVANAVAYGFDSNYALVIGKPIGAAYDLKKLGIFQSQEEIDNYTFTDKNGNVSKIQPTAVPGDLKFEDYNNDGKIDDKDRHYLGSMDPLFTLNLGNTLSYKNFSLFFNFRWMPGNDTHFLGFNPNAYGMSPTGNQLDDVAPWTPDNHTNEYPRYGYNNSMNYQYWSPRSFLKLKDLVFSYNFDQELLKPLGIAAFRLYVSGTDLFTITGWKGLDPEDGGTIAGGTTSSRFGSSGTYRTVTAGINLTF